MILLEQKRGKCIMQMIISYLKAVYCPVWKTTVHQSYKYGIDVFTEKDICVLLVRKCSGSPECGKVECEAFEVICR